MDMHLRDKIVYVFLYFSPLIMLLISGLEFSERTFFKAKNDDKIMDVTDFSIYYDLGTNEVSRILFRNVCFGQIFTSLYFDHSTSYNGR